MEGDFTRFFLFVVLSLAVLVIVTDKRRPLSAAPLDGSTDGHSQTAADQSLISRGAGWANLATNNAGCPPLSLMMPRQGVQPTDGIGIGDVAP